MCSSETILVADDNGDDAFLMSWALKKAGFNNPVETVQDGRQVIDYLKRAIESGDSVDGTIPAILILDAKLPRVDGLEVLAWIRKRPELEDLPVVMMTGAYTAALARKAGELGAIQCFQKPLGFGELVELIRREFRGAMETCDRQDYSAAA